VSTEAWIALIGVALTGSTSMTLVAYYLGRLSQRVDGLEEWRAEAKADLKIIRALLENLSGAINVRRQP
jgi:membrane protein YqaA with SNARE-associated domain